MSERVMIFGASTGGLKVYRMLKSMNIECVCFVDNAETKWGTSLENVEIKSPQVLINQDCRIVIASVYQEEIEQQLAQMKIDRKRVITREQLVGEVLDSQIDFYKKSLRKDFLPNEKKSMVIELDHGLLVGGIESWSYLIASESKKAGMNTVIYTDLQSSADEVPADIRSCIRQMDVSKQDFEQEIIRKAQDMQELLPCIFIANWMEQSFWAAWILKQIYPDQIHLIGMVHHDALCYYRRNQYLQNRVDSFLCVSDDTQQRMIHEFGIDKHKVFYKEIPIRKNDFCRKHNDKKPLMIGVGSRLDKAMKRVDLLLPLMDCLERERVEYYFKIAGDGTYYEKLKDGILERQLEKKVTLEGSLKNEEMPEFWKTCDIVVSTSESEGMGLSVLEAMSFGCVPVVTNTAGMKRFIADGKNGYIVGIGDMGLLAARIKELSANRTRLKEMSKRACRTIQEKCAPEEYLDYLKTLSERKGTDA